MKKERIYIRLTEEEKSLLTKRAYSTGDTISEFVRKVALKNEVKFLSKEDKHLINELKKELRTATNIRNQKSSERKIIDPIRQKVKDFLKKLT